MEQGQNININRSLEEFESKHHPLMTLRGSRITREQELEVEPEDMSELLQFHRVASYEWAKKAISWEAIYF